MNPRMIPPPIYRVLVEGSLEEYAARTLLRSTGLWHDRVIVKVAGGDAGFWKQAPIYLQIARRERVFALVDLEKSQCAPSLIRGRLGDAPLPGNFVLRVQVRELESWVLADSKGIAGYLGISESVVPGEPERLADPKLELVNFARRCRKPSLREDIVPKPSSKGIVGPGYTIRMGDFLENHWNPGRGAPRSQSLARALRALGRGSE